jgi:hypothetical protein
MNNVSRKFIAIFLFLSGFAIQSFCMDPPVGEKSSNDLGGNVNGLTNFRARENLELDQNLENAQRVVDTVEYRPDAYYSFTLLTQLGYTELSLKVARYLIDEIKTNWDARTIFEFFINCGQTELALETAELVVATIQSKSDVKDSFNLLSELGLRELSDRAINRLYEIKKQLSVTKGNIKAIKILTDMGINNSSSRAMEISLHISQILLSPNKKEIRERTINSCSYNLRKELYRLKESFRNESIESLVALTQCFMVLGNMDAAILSFDALEHKPNASDFRLVVLSEFPEFKQLLLDRRNFEPVLELLNMLHSRINLVGSQLGKDFIPEIILQTYDEIQRRGNFYATLGNELAD